MLTMKNRQVNLNIGRIVTDHNQNYASRQWAELFVHEMTVLRRPNRNLALRIITGILSKRGLVIDSASQGCAGRGRARMDVLGARWAATKVKIHWEKNNKSA